MHCANGRSTITVNNTDQISGAVVVVHTGVIGSAEKDVVKPYAHVPDCKAWANQYRISTESAALLRLHKKDTLATSLAKLQPSSLQVP
jgi:hypothetical protein